LAFAFDLASGTYGRQSLTRTRPLTWTNIAGRDAIADPVPNVTAQA